MPSAAISLRAPRARRRRIGHAVPWRLVNRARIALRDAPAIVRLVAAALLLVAVWAPVNWIVQTVRKPTEMFFPVSASLAKTPAETWRQYGSLFVKYSTSVITPDLLAALAQVEGSGNPVARTYWRWRLTWNPFEIYRPASSAVGMFQITDATFAEARHYCIHDHVVVDDRPWHGLQACWFNAFYTRVVPSDAVEMTAASLDRQVSRTLASHHSVAPSLHQRQNLAAVIHLCGAGVGDAYARRGFRFTAGQRCGSHDVRRYVAQVNLLKRRFARFAAEPSTTSS